jgi:hypothetical protein
MGWRNQMALIGHMGNLDCCLTSPSGRKYTASEVKREILRSERGFVLFRIKQIPIIPPFSFPLRPSSCNIRPALRLSARGTCAAARKGRS